jgi:hypothetical protein
MLKKWQIFERLPPVKMYLFGNIYHSPFGSGQKKKNEY